MQQLMLDQSYLFTVLYDEWFANKKYWFSKTPEYDKHLSDKYFIELSGFAYDNELITQPVSAQIGAIIAFDQIPRHYQRLQNACVIDTYQYSKLASEISLSLMEYLATDIETYNRISAYEWCFILLPFRHIADVKRLNTIVKFLIEKYNKASEDKSVYKTFLQKTLAKVHLLNTEATISEQKHTHKIAIKSSDQWSKYSHILQHIPTDPITVCIEDSQMFYLIKEFKKNAKLAQIDHKNIIVSLSGGVDSCICLFLAKYIYPMHTVVAIHINYNNRPECADELKFVRKFCAVLNVKLFHRTITELQRSDCHQCGLRDVYENTTRDIRFDLYKKISEMYSPALIVLGHNADDCCENIITNICKKSHYSNLSGMTIYENNILRPLLTVKKSEIMVFAIQMNVPFLKNSTPNWSARGKIRDDVLPALHSVHADCVNALFFLKDYIQSTDVMVDHYVENYVLPKFRMIDNDILAIFKLDELSVICHANVWMKIFAYYKMIISHKALNEYVAFLRRLHKEEKIKFILRPDIMVMAYVKNSKVKLVITSS
jgi:tRNA(Ile)-lysidine synthetase-like protein